jgi:protease I
VKSHSLAAKYSPVTAAFRARLTGEECDVPEFASDATDMLAGRRVALLTTHGPELPEFDVPVIYLCERGAIVDVVTQDWLFDSQPAAPGMVVLVQWLAAEICVPADLRVSDAAVDDYDAVVIIGGAWNPIMLRTDPAVLDFLRKAKNRGALIASICHGPQVLISAAMYPPGTEATGVDDIKPDLANAGFQVSDQPYVYDEAQHLLTSHNPSTLQAFCEQLGQLLLKSATNSASQ